MGLMEYLVLPFKMIRVVLFSGVPELIKYNRSRRNVDETEFNEDSIKGKVVIVTGGSSGMGKASAKEFAKRGAIVVIGDVDLKNGEITVEKIRKETGNQNVTILKLDLSDMDDVEEFARKVSMKYPKIKIILNNAGITGMQKKNILTKDGLNIYMAVNHLGHFLLTNLLLENLKSEDKSRVVSMSSTMQLMSHFKIDDINMKKSKWVHRFSLAYNNTKLCNSLFIKELGKRLEGSGITAYSICPTFVNTNIYSAFPKLVLVPINLLLRVLSFTPEQAAAHFIMHCALDKNIENETGKMYRFRKQFKEANKRLTEDLAHRLWENSSEFVHLPERLTRMSSKV